MAQRTYEGDPIDGTMKHISERDLDEEAEDVDVPQDDQYEGEVSAEYGFLDSDDLTKKEKVQRLWKRSDYDYDEWGSLTKFHEEEVAPVLDISRDYTSSVVGELVENDGGDSVGEGDSGEVQEESVDESDVEDTTDTTRTESNERTFSEAEIEHDVLKPLVFAQSFADGKELEALEEAEDLVRVLLNKGAKV